MVFSAAEKLLAILYIFASGFEVRYWSSMTLI
jgi:hypothetical protein